MRPVPKNGPYPTAMRRAEPPSGWTATRVGTYNNAVNRGKLRSASNRGSRRTDLSSQQQRSCRPRSRLESAQSLSPNAVWIAASQTPDTYRPCAAAWSSSRRMPSASEVRPSVTSAAPRAASVMVLVTPNEIVGHDHRGVHVQRQRIQIEAARHRFDRLVESSLQRQPLRQALMGPRIVRTSHDRASCSEPCKSPS